MNLWMTVPLEQKVLVFISQQNVLHAEHFRRYQTSHYRKPRVREVPIREFSICHFLIAGF